MITVVGESLVDVFTGADGAVREDVGGSPLNVAVALSRLDVPVCLVTQVGDDDRAERVLRHLADNEVELLGPPTGQGRTSTATVTLDENGVPHYDFELAWSLPPQQLPACDALHVGSLAALLEPGRDQVLDLVEQAWARDVFVSYDPNLRAGLLPDPEATRRDVEALAGRATLVKLSTEDVAVLHPGADPDDIARSFLDGDRTELVLLTRGPYGASAYVAGRQADVLAPPATVIDTVGAGDAFMAGVLAQLLEQGALGPHGGGLPTGVDALQRLLRGAGQVAALSCARPGADPPRRAELPADWPE